MTREEQIEQKAKELGQKYFLNENNIFARPNYEAKCAELACKEMMGWADSHLSHWHDAQGDDLPPIDKEVIVLLDNGKVCFAHRPNKKGYIGKSLVTGNIETFYPQTYDKGGWNIPNAKWWLDVELP
jgi:hypothetical protein